MIKKGLSIEEAFKALNGRSTTVNKGKKEKHRVNESNQKLREGVEDSDKATKKKLVREKATTKVEIPRPYDKYYQVAEIDDFDDNYNIGDQIKGYDMRILAYLDAKPEYEDTLREPNAVLTDDDDYPVCVIVGRRVYDVSIKDLPQSVKIVKFPVDEYIEKVGAENTDFDWDDGRKAKFIYTDEAEESAQVGIEFEDGTFAVVGLNNDHLCDTYAEMVECIKRYL